MVTGRLSLVDAKSLPLTASKGAFLSSNQQSLLDLALPFLFGDSKDDPLSLELPLDALLIEEKEEERRRADVFVAAEDLTISQEPRFARELAEGSVMEIGPVR